MQAAVGLRITALFVVTALGGCFNCTQSADVDTALSEDDLTRAGIDDVGEASEADCLAACSPFVDGPEDAVTFCSLDVSEDTAAGTTRTGHLICSGEWKVACL